MVKKSPLSDEMTMLRDHERWLIETVIPGYYQHDDLLSVDECMSQLFDICYQIELLKDGERERQKAFRNAQRRPVQTYMPYKK